MYPVYYVNSVNIGGRGRKVKENAKSRIRVSLVPTPVRKEGYNLGDSFQQDVRTKQEAECASLT